MTIAPGTRLGPYEIIAPIGAGGMGEVFKARDTRLDRSVAIKLLPAAFAADAQFRLRFEREAKTISQLNHPNICTLHDIGRENGVDYLVMELIEGESLADRLSRGPLPIADALRAGAQIADALDRAHRAGIVHRDLKPGNVMLSKSGVKLLDFGLAKSQASVLGVAATSETVQATEHKPLTEEGTILGTFQYMAPEQLEGEEADARTDIFALGTLLYEMATGKRAFNGKTKTSLIAAIVSSEPPPLSSLQPLTPPAFEHVVRRCLAKDRDDRWQSAHDIAEQLRWISSAGSQAGIPAPLITKRKSRERIAWMLAVIAAAVIAAAVALKRPRAEPAVAASITAPLHAPFDFMYQAAISPDGTMIAFVGWTSSAGRSLWVRRLDRSEPQQLAATQGAAMPFWSPDSTSIGFLADGKIKRVAVAGGPPQVIGDAPMPYGGASWNGRTIVIGSGGVGPLWRVDSTGGKLQQLTQLGPHEEGHRWPYFLPDGEHFLFLGDAPRTEDHHIKIGSLQDGTSHDVIQGVTNAVFAEPDQLLFVRARTLLAQTFDPKAGTIRGEPRVIAEQIVENANNHRYEFSVSANGRLVYRSARADAQLQWVDRTGKVLETVGEPRRYESWHVAPDGRRVAVSLVDADGRADDIWIIDRQRGISTRITFDPASDRWPVWSPDGSRIAFSSMRTGFGDLYIMDSANPTHAERVESKEQTVPITWSRDGSTLLVEVYTNNSVDIAAVSLPSREIQRYIGTPFDEAAPAISPDKSWLAYESNESGRSQVYIEQFPSHAGRRQLSNAGGRLPAWSASGHELFYVDGRGMLISIDAMNDKSTATALFKVPGYGYEPSADGQRFLVGQPVDDEEKAPLTFVSNWMGEK